LAPSTTVRRILLTLCLLLLAENILPARTVSAAFPGLSPTVPDLAAFAASLSNGRASVVRGLYADGLFAIPIVQQPGSNHNYVAPIDYTVTQSASASLYGSTGLLAHNYLSGSLFFRLGRGKELDLIYGDGRITHFRVEQMLRYHALSPLSVDSEFVSLDASEHLTAAALFKKVYANSGQLTLQTCIANGGDLSWGRLFVLAVPDADAGN